MAQHLEIHPATEAERLAAYRNVHDVWSGGLDMQAHLARRLKSPQHNRASWFVGCSDGKVVTSLACYDLQFRLQPSCEPDDTDGRVVPGIAIGSVHTLAEYRGRGFAPQLLNWVEEYAASRGATISLLYSDIDPAYYAQLGYHRCPAWRGARTLAGPSLLVDAADGRRRELVEIDAQSNLQLLADCYARHQRRLRLSIERSASYWRYLSEKQPRDMFILLAVEGCPQGYFRVAGDRETMRLVDMAFDRSEAGFLSGWYQRLCNLARDRRYSVLEGWMSDSSACQQTFTMEPRPREITMLKALGSEVKLDPQHLAAAACFQEVDHV